MLEYITHNPDFIGREDVLQLMSEVLLRSQTNLTSSDSGDVKIFALCGLGGTGKTEIAAEFALRHKDKYDAIFWIRADEFTKLEHRFSQIAVQLELETSSESTSHVVSRELVKGWLSKPWKWSKMGKHDLRRVDATWLIIFDNADDPQVLLDYWPIQSSGSILITSQSPLSKTIFSTKPSEITLEPFGVKDGALLMKRLTNENDEEQVSENIVELLGGLPLAIAQIAGVICRQELTLPEFLESFSDASEHPALFDSKLPPGHRCYQHNISSVWVLENLQPATKALLQVISFLDPDCIQEYMLVSPTVQLMLEQYPKTRLVFIEARTELIQASLITRNKISQEITVHRLVQDSLRAKMTPEEFTKTYWSTVQLIWAQWPTAMGAPTRKGASVATPKFHFTAHWPRCAALYPHVWKLHRQYEESVQAMKHDLRVPILQLAALLNDAAW